MQKYFLAVIFMMCTCVCHGGVHYSWSQFDGENLSFRVITDEGSCPYVTVDGKKKQMRLRHGPNENFPVSTCQIELDRKSKGFFAGNKISTVVEPKNILLIGDTGCGSSSVRTKQDNGYQECADINKWPFPLLIKNAAQLNPDLIIHLGDIHYIHNQCKHGVADCGENGILGYDSWRQDFFEPMKEILNTVPVFFVKGNHENCWHSGEGWNKFFANVEVWQKCELELEPAKITNFPNISFLLADNSLLLDNYVHEKAVSVYKPYISDAFGTFRKQSSRFKVFLAHKPLYDIGYSVDSLKTKKFYNLSLFEAMKGVDMSFIDLMIHGHIHHFSLAEFSEDGIPTHVVVGNSGNHIWFDESTTSDFSGGPMPYLHVVYYKHGFALLNTEKKQISYFDVNAKRVGTNNLNWH